MVLFVLARVARMLPKAHDDGNRAVALGAAAGEQAFNPIKQDADE